MRRTTSLSAFVLFAAIAPGLLFAEVFSTTLPDGRRVELTLAEGWKATADTLGPGRTIELSQSHGTDATVLITVFPETPDNPIKDLTALRTLVAQQGTALLPTAVQKSLELIEVKIVDGGGFLFHLTDRNPEKGPGDFREARSGAMLIGGRFMTVTILSHTADSEFVAQALKTLETTRVVK